MSKQRGFTLIEIMVAMAIFALIGVASTAVLTAVIDSNELSEERFARLQHLQRAMLTIERDMLQAIARPVRVEGEAREIVMKGGVSEDSDADGIAFVRGGWQNPQLLLPRSTQQFVAYRLNDTTLERLHGNYVDNVIGYEPMVRPLLEGVSDLNVEFYVADGNAADNFDQPQFAWQESYVGATLPLAVAVEFTTEEFGLIRREFALQEGQP